MPQEEEEEEEEEEFECGEVCWERWLRVERCAWTDGCVWSCVLGPIVECGGVC